MGRKVRYGIMALLLIIFCTAVSVILMTRLEYEQEDRVYEQIAEEYTRRVEPGEKSGAPEGTHKGKGARIPEGMGGGNAGSSGDVTGNVNSENDAGAHGGTDVQNHGGTGVYGGKDTGRSPGDAADIWTGQESALLEVDFDRLKELNGDVAGWIYCEGTAINYPVLQGEDNEYYLYRNLNRQSHKAGSIFVEESNQPDFRDSNTIIYGHHMKNGSMFAGLDNWARQEYYEEHSVMWLLTPEQDYLILLLAGYTTPAASDAYTIFSGPCDELEEYLERCMENSDFTPDFGLLEAYGKGEPGGDDKYVVLSTCDYSFQDARYVLHGMLVPVER